MAATANSGASRPHSMAGAHFGANAIIRGAQLTLVGAHRALQNPRLFTSDHYRQAAIAVAAGIAIRILISIPTVGVRILVWLLGLFMDLKGSTWDEEIIEGLEFLEHSVLQVPFFLMSLMRYITPTLDNMFMESLDWVDRTYVVKHKSDDPTTLRKMYYPNLKEYEKKQGGERHAPKKGPYGAMIAYLVRSARRAGISLAVYAASRLPYIGWLILPAASFYTFRKAVGLEPAAVIFGLGIFLPKKYLVTFLQSYFASRSLMRQLLDPYFSRIHFSKEQKARWFKDREGVLFGFALGFFVLIRIPLVGVLIYGIAEASTAYLVTKITDPPPPPQEEQPFVESQVRWSNKHEFLNLPLAAVDAIHATSSGSSQDKPGNYPDKTFS